MIDFIGVYSLQFFAASGSNVNDPCSKTYINASTVSYSTFYTRVFVCMRFGRAIDSLSTPSLSFGSFLLLFVPFTSS